MKLGLDHHGVLDKNPRLFVKMALDVLKLGGEVHIITGSPWSIEIERQLFSYNTISLQISYNAIMGQKYWTHYFSVQEFMTKKGYKHVLDDKGYPHFPASDWNLVKADYCMREEIDLHIDDQLEYLQHFKTPYMLFNHDPTVTPHRYTPLFKES